MFLITDSGISVLMDSPSPTTLSKNGLPSNEIKKFRLTQMATLWLETTTGVASLMGHNLLTYPNKIAYSLGVDSADPKIFYIKLKKWVKLETTP